MSEIHVKRVQGYLVNMSNGGSIQIDAEEIEKVMAAVENSAIAVVKQGVINPSFFVSITKDRERLIEYIHESQYDNERRLKGMEPLGSIFLEGTVIGDRLAAAEPKKLSTPNVDTGTQ